MFTGRTLTSIAKHEVKNHKNYLSVGRRYLNYNHFLFHPAPKPKSFFKKNFSTTTTTHKVIDLSAKLSLAGMAAFTFWIMKEYGFRTREKKIIGTYIDLSKDNHRGLIVSSESF